MAPKRKRQEEEEEEELLYEAEAEELISDEEEGEEAEEEEEEEVLEPKVLPNRTTRGGRINKMLEDEDSADEDFWGQEFFKEEAEIAEYSQSESEEEDVPDTDFSDSESDDDADEEENEAKMRREERRKQKVLKPPGASKKPPALKIPQPSGPKKAAKMLSPKSPVSPNTRAAIKAAQDADIADMVPRSFRESTKQKVEEAEAERERAEQEKRPKKRRQEPQVKVLTQDELLSEAAQTEIENLKSLEIMQALEEEVKKKAAVKRARYSGPYIRYRSKKVNDESLITCEVANMLPPPEMQKQKAPQPKKPTVCAMTGKPAKYLDPLTKRPYSDIAAFQMLRQYSQPAPYRY